jgi:hypothetical protein
VQGHPYRRNAGDWLTVAEDALGKAMTHAGNAHVSTHDQGLASMWGDIARTATQLAVAKRSDRIAGSRNSGHPPNYPQHYEERLI